MKKILVPTDFSKNASSAFQYAYAFAAARKMDIDLINFVMPQVETSDFSMSSGHITINLEKIAKDGMKIWKEENLAKINNVVYPYTPIINSYVRTDRPVHGIKHFAKDGNYDLVICGNQGENINALEKLLGTVSSGLSQELSTPVIFVPIDYPYDQINYIGYASSLHPSDPYELWKALQILAPDIPITRFYHVSNDHSESTEKKKIELEKYLYSHNDSLQIKFYDVDSDDIDKNLLSLINDFNLEMLVMTKRKKSFFERFRKSHTKSMLRKANIPLLVMEEK